MNTSKTVRIGRETYKMSQNSQTHWVFVWSKGRSYSIAKIIDGQIITIDRELALRDVSNEELANAWLSS